MRKIRDTYYYVYADMERGKPTSLGYSVSKSPMGPFEYKGIIADKQEFLCCAKEKEISGF